MHRTSTVLGIQHSVNKFKNIEDEQIRGHYQGNTFLSRDYNSRLKIRELKRIPWGYISVGFFFLSLFI